jgi:catechol 2,3-dioxygenase-like lactoylglutathione lyase family enzyme
MEKLISHLVQKFERGTLGRRELIQSLSIIAAAGSTASAQTPSFQGGAISHVSLSVSDLQRSTDFYRKAFGLNLLSEDKKLEVVRLGKTKTLLSLRRAAPVGVIDHFAISVEGFNRDAVAAELKTRGITTSQSTEAGFHVTDPDGYPVQID